ncbi:MAG: hypothetical protein RLZZ215_31 [Pseudomonadota bacterium]
MKKTTMQNGDTRKTNLAEAFKIIESMPEDFMIDGREQDLPQEREGLDDLWTELPSNPKSP